MNLNYNDKTHEYELDGLMIPSVTQIIQDVMPTNFYILAENLEYKADLGKKVHLTTEIYDEGNLDLKILYPILKNYLDGWIKFKQDFEFEVEEIELRLHHSTYRFAGRLDRVGMIGKDKVLVDIKTGVVKKTDVLQTAGYKILYNQDKKQADKIKKRMAVYLAEGDYRVVFHQDETDLNVFLSCLTVYNFKRR